MKDSQLGAQREHTRAKYIKADNERFSTEDWNPSEGL